MEDIVEKLNLTAKCDAHYPLSAYDYIDFVIITLCACTFIFGLISWKTIADFRSFKNYIFIYLIIINIVNAVLRNINFECIADKFSDPSTALAVLFVAEGLYTYFALSANYWLMLLYYDTYLNVVKVYNNHILRRYLKANLWAWGVPSIICLFIYVIVPALVPSPGGFVLLLQICSLLVPLVYNGVTYVIIIFSLLKTKMVSTVIETKRRFLRMLTFMFLLWALSLLTFIIPVCYANTFSLQIIKLLFSLKDLTLILYFLTGSTNRSLWKEYYGTNTNKRLLNTYF